MGEAGGGDGERLAAGLAEALNGSATIGGAQVRLRASVGRATSRPGVHDADAILHEADMAMYASKNSMRASRR